MSALPYWVTRIAVHEERVIKFPLAHFCAERRLSTLLSVWGDERVTEYGRATHCAVGDCPLLPRADRACVVADVGLFWGGFGAGIAQAVCL